MTMEWLTFHFFFSVDGQDFLLNLKCPTSGLETGFEYFILNLSSIRSIYISFYSPGLPTFLSCRISIPKICFVVPKSFMSNVFDNSLFNFWIMSASCPIINISSTYNKIMMNLLLGNLWIYTHGSKVVLLYSWLIMKDSNFLYHCRGACFSPYRIFFHLLTMFSFPLTLKPSSYSIKISSSRSPCTNAVFTSSCSNSRFIRVANPSITQTEHIFKIGENISSKSIPCFWPNPFTTNWALYFSNFSSSFFSLNTYLFLSAFLLFGSFVNS